MYQSFTIEFVLPFSFQRGIIQSEVLTTVLIIPNFSTFVNRIIYIFLFSVGLHYVDDVVLCKLRGVFMFWNNLVFLCNKHNTNPNAVCSALNLSNATATHWKNGSLPRDTTLKKLADYFGVSVEYLKGEGETLPLTHIPDVGYALFNGDEEMTEGRRAELENYIKSVIQRENPPSEESGSEDKLDEELIKRLCSLNEDELARVDAFVQGLLANRST